MSSVLGQANGAIRMLRSVTAKRCRYHALRERLRWGQVVTVGDPSGTFDPRRGTDPGPPYFGAASASPSGSLPAAIVPTTSSVARSRTLTWSAAVLATKARLPEGSTRIPTVADPVAIRLT